MAGSNPATLRSASSHGYGIYQLLKDNVEYKDLGADFFDRLHPDRLRRHLVKRLEGLGYDVTLASHQPDPPAA
jgi:hypothetical protein